MSTLTFDGHVLVYRTPYNPGLVSGLKSAIPSSDRQWDAAQKVWLIAPQHGQLLADLTQQYLGEMLVVPVVPLSSQEEEDRILDVRYIGMTKERGNGERTAFGWSGGSWSVIFPETVLRAWFDAPKRPDEETTLYQVLAVKPDVDAQGLKTAYRRLARQWHPDVCREPDAAEIFKAIQHAYEILSDPTKRARYNAGLALAAMLGHQQAVVETGLGYRTPLRCGLIMAHGYERLKRFVVEEILIWEDIVDAQGRTLSTSWPNGAEMFMETWL